jgi:hypothetical protein
MSINQSLNVLSALAEKAQEVTTPEVIMGLNPAMEQYKPTNECPEEFLEELVKETEVKKEADYVEEYVKKTRAIVVQYIEQDESKPAILGFLSKVFTKGLDYYELIHDCFDDFEGIPDAVKESEYCKYLKRNSVISTKKSDPKEKRWKKKNYLDHCLALKAFFKQENEKTNGFEDCSSAGKWNKVLSTLPEKEAKIVAQLSDLEKERYFSVRVLEKPLVSPGLIGRLETVPSLNHLPRTFISSRHHYGGYPSYSGVETDQFIEIIPTVVTPLENLTNESFDGQYVITMAKVKSDGFPQVDIDFEQVQVTSVSASGSSSGYFGRSVSVGAKATTCTYTRIHSNQESQVPFTIGDEGVSIPCTYNQYEMLAEDVFDLKKELLLIMQRGYDDGTISTNAPHPNEVQSFLNATNDHEILVGGRMKEGVLEVDTLYDPMSNISFNYFLKAEKKIY